MDDDRQHTVLVDRASVGGTIVPSASSGGLADTEPSEAERVLGGRKGLGSQGPPLAAVPADAHVDDAMFRAHLAHLVEAPRPASAPLPLAAVVIAPREGPLEGPLEGSEHRERELDGIPHVIVALTAVLSPVCAVILAGLFRFGGTAGKAVAVALALIAVPALVLRLSAKAARDRDHRSR